MRVPVTLVACAGVRKVKQAQARAQEQVYQMHNLLLFFPPHTQASKESTAPPPHAATSTSASTPSAHPHCCFPLLTGSNKDQRPSPSRSHKHKHKSSKTGKHGKDRRKHHHHRDDSREGHRKHKSHKSLSQPQQGSSGEEGELLSGRSSEEERHHGKHAGSVDREERRAGLSSGSGGEEQRGKRKRACSEVPPHPAVVRAPLSLAGFLCEEEGELPASTADQRQHDKQAQQHREQKGSAEQEKQQKASPARARSPAPLSPQKQSAARAPVVDPPVVPKIPLVLAGAEEAGLKMRGEALDRLLCD